MLGWYCFSMEKLETWIYIQWFWLQIVMVSPGTPCEKYWVPDKKSKQVCNWKCLGLCVTRQLIWLISLTDSKTLYYCSTKSKSEQIYAFLEQIYVFLFYDSFQHKKPFCQPWWFDNAAIRSTALIWCYWQPFRNKDKN